MTTPPQPITPDPAPCSCNGVCVDPETLRKLRDGLRRNADAVTKTIDRILAELGKEQSDRAA